MSVYKDFLRLLDFSEDEMEHILPDWEQACKSLGLNESDVRFATDEWLPKHWDLSLHGVRMCIGAYVRELIELSKLSEYKARGDKILYCSMQSHPACVYANKISGGDGLHISFPDYLLTTVLSAFFHKHTVLADGDTPCMNPLCGHCGMNSLHADARYKGLIVEPTVVWNWGLYCNEGPKTDEMMDGISGSHWNYVLSTIPKDYNSSIPEAEDSFRVSYLKKQLEEGQRRVSEYTGIVVTESDVLEAEEQYLRYLDKVEKLTDLVCTADPQPITGNELTIFSAPTLLAFDNGFKHLETAIDVLTDEVERRVSRSEGPLPKGSPRLACQFVPFCVPWVSAAFKENGVNLTFNTFFSLASMQRKYFDKDDVYRSIAQQWFVTPSAVNMMNEANLVTEMLRRYPADGVLYGFFSFDRWIGGLEKTLIRVVEQQTGIPHYYLEGEFWDDVRYSLSDRLTRIQNIAYTAKINHMMNGAGHAKK